MDDYRLTVLFSFLVLVPYAGWKKTGMVKKLHMMCKQSQWMNQFKNLFPFSAAIGVFFLACNSPMLNQMIKKASDENGIKPIPAKEFK